MKNLTTFTLLVFVISILSMNNLLSLGDKQTQQRTFYLDYIINLQIMPQSSSLSGQSEVTFHHYDGKEVQFKLLKSLQIVTIKSEDLDYTIDESNPDYNTIKFNKKAQSQNLEPIIYFSYAGKVMNLPQETNLNQKHSNSLGIISPKNDEGVYLPAGSFYPSIENSLSVFDVTIGSPKDYIMITSGNVIKISFINNDKSNTPDKQIEYKTKFPDDELTIVGGKYVEYIKQKNDVTFALYTYDSTKYADTYLNAVLEYYNIYTNLFGDYPFNRFSIVDNFFATGFGMPAYTLLSGKLLAMPWVTLSPGSLAHEFVHNWWGNSVYVDYNGGNWCEALTTFSANYYYNVVTNKLNDALDWRKKALMSIDALAPNKNYPVIDFKYQENMDDAVIGYQKGGFIFYEIMKLIGKDAFFTALKDFAQKYRGKRAYWKDIINEFIEFTPKDFTKKYNLEKIIHPYLYSKDDESIKLKEVKKNNNNLEITIEKSQDYTTSLPIKFIGNNQSKIEYFIVSGNTAKINYKSSFNINEISIDPNYEVLRKLYPWEKPFSFNQTLSSNPIIVIPDETSPNYKLAQEFYKEMVASNFKCTVKKAKDLTENDIKNNSLLLLGTSQDNSLIKSVVKNFPKDIKIQDENISYSDKSNSIKESILLISTDHPTNPNHYCTVIYFDNLPSFEPLKRLFHYQSYSLVLLSLNKPGRPLFSEEIFPNVKSKEELIKEVN